MQNYYDDPRERATPFAFTKSAKPEHRLAEAVVTPQQFNGILPLERVLSAGTVFAELSMPYKKNGQGGRKNGEY